MAWNYRVIQNKDKSFNIHEVYYDDDGNITAWTATPILGGFEDKDELSQTLEMIKSDCQKDFGERQVLSMAELEKKFPKDDE